ncbi:SET domain-containing protein [Skeletonema marinoi]|uniref:SET domain-containing protein n=1 Tax=Skeletonema marinoi TaxID=267567 RepID=A0AAD9D947_9STRA|nr:SET domain-containing protein [Skeletonema marinoi]
MDPRQRWNAAVAANKNEGDNNNTEEGEMRQPPPQRQQQGAMTDGNKRPYNNNNNNRGPPPPYHQQHHQQQRGGGNHSIFRQRFQPPPPQSSSSSQPSSYQKQQQNNNNHNSEGFQQRFQPPPPPHHQQQQQQQHNRFSPPPPRFSPPPASHPQQQQQQQGPPPPSWNKKPHTVKSNNYYEPPPPPSSSSHQHPPPRSAPPPPPSSTGSFAAMASAFPPPPSSGPLPQSVESNDGSRQQQRLPPQAPSSSNSNIPTPTPSSAVVSSANDTNNNNWNLPLVKSEVIPSAVKSEFIPSSVKNEVIPSSANNTPRDYEQEQAHNTEYTQSLHWRNAKSIKIEKRPIDLPPDVDHIDDVEWGEDASSNATTIESSLTNTATNNNNNEPSSSNALLSHISQISQLERAQRPKYKRPEPCFCEPDIDTESKCCIDETCALYACQEECGTSCPGGPLCGNKRIQRKEWKRLSVFDAGLKGRGLMVQEPVYKGEFIIEYVGVAVKRQYLDGLFARYKHERMLYIMALDGDIYLDARHRGGIARYINHSCEPNCVVHRWRVRGIIRACVFALRDIGTGEELSFDYQWDRKRGRAVTRCYCGSEKCRGTLEIPKDFEEVEELEELEGHWIEPNTNSSGRVGKEIMNRVIKVYFEDDGEDYVADVAQYDPESGRHQLMYRGDNADVWTDLSTEKWMILDEEGEKYVIARKDRNYQNDSLLLCSNVTSPRSDVSRSASPVPGAKVKNYMYIQTPVKDNMLVSHILYKCQRHSRVHIDVTNITVRDRPEGEDNDLKKAMDASQDGSVWKLVVTGLEVKKAIEWLEKQNARITDQLNGVVKTTSSSLTDQLMGEGGKPYTEMIIPRVVLDVVRKRFFSLKGYCFGVEVDFKHSDSKSKQFAKLTLSAELKEDMDKAMLYLNEEIEKECMAIGAPRHYIGCYDDLGFLGGVLSNEDYKLLFKRTGRGSGSPSKTIRANEDLQDSAFANSFEKKNRCSIWVQAVEDMGRVSHNRVINEANPNGPRKIYFGAPPHKIAVLWGYIQTRLADFKRGVVFMNLGANHIYQNALEEPLKRNKRPATWNYFFEFVQKTSGASVQPDPVTDNHLRIDGGDASLSELSARRVKEKVNIAKELIALQIELLRDHHIRQHRWGFGRDWALLLESTPTQQPSSGSTSSQDLTAMAKIGTADSMRLSDPRAVGTACLEISEIVTSAGLSENVSAHACIIFYRYINLPDAIGLNANFKLRDIQLASLFIANKSQKVKKWNRLEAVLEHAYRVFYPGSLFNPNSEEAKNWERRVIKAEKTILSALNYDVFWTGVDWVINAVTGTKAMAEPLAENAMAWLFLGTSLLLDPCFG